MSWAIPSTVGPALAGLILDNFNPNYLWYASGVLCLLAVLGFLWLHGAAQERLSEVQVATTD
jgi:predicted MFS family arabinose efflux permease